VLAFQAAWAAQNEPVHIWVMGQERNAWPLVSLSALERRLPVRFDIWYKLTNEEAFRAIGPESGVMPRQDEWDAAAADWLLTKSDAALVFGPAKPETDALIRRYVDQGGFLIWTAPPKKEFADVLPFDPDAKPEPYQGTTLASTNAYLVGVPLAELSSKPLPAFAPKLDKNDIVLIQTDKAEPVMVLARRGKARILFAPGALPIPREDFASWNEKDTEAIWILVWERMLPLIRGAAVPPAVALGIEPKEIRAGGTCTIGVSAKGKRDDVSYSAFGRSDTMRPPGNAAVAPDHSVLPGWHRVDVRDRKTLQLLAADFVRLLPTVDLSIAAPPGKFGYAVGEDVVLDVKLKNAIDRVIDDARVVLAMQDADGRTHHLEQRTVSLQAGAEQTQQFKWTMPDLGPRAWFFWAIAECREGKTVLGRAEMPVHRFKKYSVREDWQWSTWTQLSRFPQTVVPDVLELFEDAGYNALGCVQGAGDHPWCYRWGLRTYVEMPSFAGIDNIGWPGENFEEFMAQQARIRWPHVTQSSIAAICSYGEEPGFGPAFGTTWHWGDGPAPDPANFWFRKYLRQLYADSIEKLNAQWGTAFKSFDEIQLDLEFGGSGHRGYADMGRMGPITPGRNLSRYVDCHSFYHWYFHRWNREAAKQVAALNPTATPVMSMDNEFMTQLDLIGMYVHWMYPKEWMAGYNAYQRQFAADPAGFIMNWGFFDDPRINNQIYLLSLMQGAIPMSFWYDFPLQFNYDLTHSRASLQFRELRRRLEPKLGAILHPVPKVDKEIGIYLPLLDWKATLGRPAFMLGLREDNKNVPWMAGVGGYEQPIHSALCENGYAPRFISRKDFAECRLIFVPYAQSVPAEDAQALKDAVQNGAIVVATPKLATHDVHGKPLDRAPGEGLGELFGIAAEPAITSCYNLLGTAPTNAWEKDAVIAFPQGVHHPGGDPLRLQSFGYQKITAVAPDAKVQARYPDGTPAIILRQAGKGAAIYLNVCYHWSEEWYTQFSEHREAFRIFLSEIVKYAKIGPAHYFLEMNYRTGIHEPRIGVYPYTSPDGSLTYLRMYNDWRSPELTANLVLREPVARVLDIMTNEELPQVASADGARYIVTMKPAQGRILALLKERLAKIEVIAPEKIKAGEVMKVRVRLLNAKDEPLKQQRPIGVAIQRYNGSMLGKPRTQHAEVAGEAETSVSFALEDQGRYLIGVYSSWQDDLRGDAITQIAPDNRAQALPAPVASFRSPGPPELCGATEQEFLALMRRLKEVYLTADGDKTLLSARLATRPDGRHAIVTRLAGMDWQKMTPVLIRAIRDGEVFIVGGEDARREASTYWRSMHSAIHKIRDESDGKTARGFNDPDVALIPLGSGCLIVFRKGPDSTSGTPAEYALWHERFPKTLKYVFQEDGTFRVGMEGGMPPVSLDGWVPVN